MYDYLSKLYGYTIISNIKLPLALVKGKDANEGMNIILTYESANIPNVSRISIFQEDEKIILITSYAIYTIDVANNSINVKSKRVEDVISTLFNLPFILFLSHKSKILLHAGSVQKGNSVNAFCGSKGVGKSTLISFLSRKIPFYSDDTVCIDENLVCENSGNFIKLKEDIFSCHFGNTKSFSEPLKNMQNKAYLSCEDLGLLKHGIHKTFISKIFFIKRDENSSVFSIIEIRNDLKKRALLLSNIVGIEYLNSQMVSKILSSNVFKLIIQDVKFFELSIPNNISDLRSQIVDICKNI